MPASREGAVPSISPESARTGRAPRRWSNGEGETPTQLLATATRHLAARRQGEFARAARADHVAELLKLLVGAVERHLVDPEAAVGARLASPDGRRLLELLRGEVVRGWAENGVGGEAILPTLAAIERVRDAMESDGARLLGGRLTSPDGLKLLVDVAHDLRSSLNSILFLAETLQRGQSGVVNDLQRRQLGLIYGAALGLSSMTSDVVDFARGGGEQLLERSPVPFSVAGVLSAVCDIVRPIAEEKGLDFRVQWALADQRLGHPYALSRVLLNLATNSLKFTEQGFVDLSTRDMGGARVEFSVRDSGPGIPPEVASRLYDPVRPVAGRRGRAFSQTGLGLAICRELVRAMGSDLQLETRHGWGTRFFFELDLPSSRPSSRRRGAVARAARRV